MLGTHMLAHLVVQALTAQADCQQERQSTSLPQVVGLTFPIDSCQAARLQMRLLQNTQHTTAVCLCMLLAVMHTWPRHPLALSLCCHLTPTPSPLAPLTWMFSLSQQPAGSGRAHPVPALPVPEGASSSAAADHVHHARGYRRSGEEGAGGLLLT